MYDSAEETARLEELAAKLTLPEKVQLLTGRDFWNTWPIEKIGLRRILVSDGPSGVRGEVWDERSPSLNLPSATALSSSWDRDIAARYGAASAVEARRKGVDVVLGPTINLHRSPLGGRHFEAFSEDPVLTAELAAAYVEGVQANGVGATPKHYIANDYESERFTASTEVSERALRELYLLAFEKSITEAHAWLVMSSYNSINGTTATESELLETPLNSEWGFDGVVISDWTAVRTVESAKASQDLVMPGPDGPWGAALVAAVEAGEVSEEAIDRKVIRILRLAARVGALEGFAPVQAAPVSAEDGIAFARTAEAAGSVLLSNDGTLPLAAADLRKVAVVGHNGLQARTQGGGSATVLPERIVTPLEGLTAALPDAEVTYSIGAVVQEGIAELPLEEIVNPSTSEPGMLVRFLDEDGTEMFREDRRATALVYFGGDAPIDTSHRMELSMTWTPTRSGDVLFGFAAVGHGRILVGGELVHEETSEETGGMDLGASLLAPPSIVTPLTVAAGEPVDLTVEFDMKTRDASMAGVFGITAGLEADNSDPEALIAEAVAAAADADVAIVVVGTNSRVESEGFDRKDLDLPGRQDDLVRAVLAANPNTVVVVNSGSPVVMPWHDDVKALLLTYFGGQEYGNALADLLFGAAEPGGRLPTTWPETLSDVPVLDVTPKDGLVAYDEGIHIGYRAWLRAGRIPAFEFGHGLGYTTWNLDGLTATAAADGGFTVSVDVANTGAREGKQVVQAYLSRSESAVERPARWLAGFAPVVVAAGETRTVVIDVPARAFAHWDAGWQHEAGAFQLHVGTSVTQTPLEADVELASDGSLV
ncbi:beta-glucosidase [Frondihabitans sp. PhB188]|uniref:beta-glucosidase family protein n=1 Tax=Frondihabitans sp. PhB188 TaxID=2485200 RepID=UPI000F4A80A5|nr:glycoside hydrolase family 3 C-terminal domain-containing protein [Frondihabitans sp. PhB188]ROQ39558.1 beta-glucosidase [Frondihabitans sp. PhB188]